MHNQIRKDGDQRYRTPRVDEFVYGFEFEVYTPGYEGGDQGWQRLIFGTSPCWLTFQGAVRELSFGHIRAKAVMRNKYYCREEFSGYHLDQIPLSDGEIMNRMVHKLVDLLDPIDLAKIFQLRKTDPADTHQGVTPDTSKEVKDEIRKQWYNDKVLFEVKLNM